MSQDWVIDLDRPLIIAGADWRDRQAEVMGLPPYFFVPPDDVGQALAAFRDGRTPTMTPDLAARVRRHIDIDFVAHLHHFCFYEDRDTRRFSLANPSPSQRALAWRIMATIADKRPVRLNLLKERQGGFSWLFAQMSYWFIRSHRNIGGLTVAQDRTTSQQIFKYLRDAHERVPNFLRPASQYSRRDELVLRNPDPRAREQGDIGQNSSMLVQTAGNDFVGTGQPVQLLNASEVGKWHRVCDPEIVFTSVANSIQNEPGTVIARESTALGAGSYWNKEWDASVLMGKPRWNGYTPVFFPWHFDPRNTNAGPDVEPQASPRSEFGDEVRLLTAFGVTHQQLRWRREAIKKQPAGRNKVDLFAQEHPATPDEAWLHSFGKWAQPGELAEIARRTKADIASGLLSEEFRGHMTMPMSREATGVIVPIRYDQTETELFRRDASGPLAVYRWPEWERDYVVATALGTHADGAVQPACCRVYQRTGSKSDNFATLRLCAEWTAVSDDYGLAQVMFWLGWLYASGRGRHRIPALQAWSSNGRETAVPFFLLVDSGFDPRIRFAYPRSRVFRGGDLSTLRPGMNPTGVEFTKGHRAATLSLWRAAAVRGEIQATAGDIEDASGLTVLDDGDVDPAGRPGLVAAAVASHVARFVAEVRGREDAERDMPKDGTVAWAMRMHQKTQTLADDDVEDIIAGG